MWAALTHGAAGLVRLVSMLGRRRARARMRRLVTCAALGLLPVLGCGDEGVDEGDAAVDCERRGEPCACLTDIGDPMPDGVVLCSYGRSLCDCPECVPGRTQWLGCDGWHLQICTGAGRWDWPRGCPPRQGS